MGGGLYGKMSVSNSDMYKRRRGGEGEGLYGKMSVSNSEMYKRPPRKQNLDYKRN